jgi:hypothetical protein
MVCCDLGEDCVSRIQKCLVHMPGFTRSPVLLFHVLLEFYMNGATIPLA